MKKRRGETLVEVLIAFVIILIAISISVIASTTIIGLKTEARIKSDIFDIAYSQAEQQMSTSTILANKTITQNSLAYSIETISTETTITFKLPNNSTVKFPATAVNLIVYPIEFEDKYKITMMVYPKQKNEE